VHVNLGCGLDTCVPQDLLHVLHRPVPEHVGAQRAAHHLKGHEFLRNAAEAVILDGVAELITDPAIAKKLEPTSLSNME